MSIHLSTIALILAILSTGVSLFLSALIVGANAMSDMGGAKFEGGGMVLITWAVTIGLWLWYFNA